MVKQFEKNSEGKLKSLHTQDDINFKLLNKFIKSDNVYENMLKNREKVLYYASECKRYKDILVGNFISKN